LTFKKLKFGLPEVSQGPSKHLFLYQVSAAHGAIFLLEALSVSPVKVKTSLVYRAILYSFCHHSLFCIAYHKSPHVL